MKLPSYKNKKFIEIGREWMWNSQWNILSYANKTFIEKVREWIWDLQWNPPSYHNEIDNEIVFFKAPKLKSVLWKQVFKKLLLI